MDTKRLNKIANAATFSRRLLGNKTQDRLRVFEINDGYTSVLYSKCVAQV